jgi:dGTP triphosphohydrolase
MKEALTGQRDFPNFKTVECQIMDIADDIAYSTYDFEDAMKAGFTSLLDVLRLSNQPKLLRRVAVKVWKNVHDRHDRFDESNIPPNSWAKSKRLRTRYCGFCMRFVVASFQILGKSKEPTRGAGRGRYLNDQNWHS